MKKAIWAVLFVVLVALRFILAPNIVGYEVDVNFFNDWSKLLLKVGLINVYTSGEFMNYMPVYLYFLYAIGWLSKAFTLVPFETAHTILNKTPAILADLGLVWLAATACSAKYIAKFPNKTIMLMMLLCPAIAINSVFWGQMDSIFMLALVTSIILLGRGKLEWSAVLFTTAALIKPQALIFAPLFLFVFWEAKSWKRLGFSAIYALATLLLICLPFSKTGLNITWIFEAIINTLGTYSLISMNAFNTYFLVGLNWKQEISPLWGVVKVLVPALLMAYTAFLYFKKKTNLFYLGFILSFGVFMLLPEMHERYSFPALICLYFAFASTGDKKLLPLLYTIVITLFANCTWLLAYLKLGGGDWTLLGGWLNAHGKLLSGINLAAFVYGVCVLPWLKNSKNCPLQS
ncbi:hypothetical protein FACS189425_01730 [Clostridia bacterium]|nr:hypothetical protein FACS189425_01730 [Clostridia bacterium]